MSRKDVVAKLVLVICIIVFPSISLGQTCGNWVSNYCGEVGFGGCYCDADCIVCGDCCPDACKICGINCVKPKPRPNSCEGHGDGRAPGGCWCDDFCHNNNDCCPDYWELCYQVPEKTRKDNCGGVDVGGCWCDDWCAWYGDCCLRSIGQQEC